MYTIDTCIPLIVLCYQIIFNVTQLQNEQREAAKPKLAAPARIVATEEDNIVLPSPTKYYRFVHHFLVFLY